MVEYWCYNLAFNLMDALQANIYLILRKLILDSIEKGRHLNTILVLFC